MPLPAPFNGARGPDPSVKPFPPSAPASLRWRRGPERKMPFHQMHCWSACATRLTMVLIDLAPPVQLRLLQGPQTTFFCISLLRAPTSHPVGRDDRAAVIGYLLLIEGQRRGIFFMQASFASTN
jgi:hypothetical protein